MAATAISLQLKTKHTTFRNPTFLRLFSSSSTPDSSNPDDPPPTSSSQSQSQSQSQSRSSYFTDVKASLKNQHQHHRQQPRKPFSFSSPFQTPTTVASLEEIRKNLAEFRRSSAAPPPREKSHSSQHLSFHELYSRNVISKSEEPSAAAGNESNKLGGREKISFDSISQRMRQLRANNNNNNNKINNMMSLSNFKQALKMRPVDGPAVVIGGADNLPASVFGKEMKQKGKESRAAMKTEFVKTYDYPELGEKLRKLRPETAKGEHWFSLGELNERLIKLREMEEKETESGTGGYYKDLKLSLESLKVAEDEKNKKRTIQRLNVLSQLDGTPDFMLKPPKEHLVEKYFHPDNMSSSEKLKLELQKVRDEFKMSESDCGSARVQVAQLTTKIKHLSTVLHKKDKHSKKGLQAMVQRRKKLLKYLRRTDWDSYCLVLSKLGLRDNPDYKNLT